MSTLSQPSCTSTPVPAGPSASRAKSQDAGQRITWVGSVVRERVSGAAIRRATVPRAVARSAATAGEGQHRTDHPGEAAHALPS